MTISPEAFATSAAFIGSALLIAGMIWKVKSVASDMTAHQKRVKHVRTHAHRHNTPNWIVSPTLRQCSMAVMDDPSLKYSVPIRYASDIEGRDYPAVIHVMDHRSLSKEMSKMLEIAAAWGSTVVLLS